MTLKDALALVYDLANENTLDENDQELQDEVKKQQTALNIVHAHILSIKPTRTPRVKSSGVRSSGVRQTGCRHCGQDIENFYPYRKGEWRDRGNNPNCPDNSGKLHAPIIKKK